MGASREKEAADYDLERFVEMFDGAMTSTDPRVKQALRQLMMMVILTDTRDHEAQQRASHGPLRQLVSDVQAMVSRIHALENQIHQVKYQAGLNRATAAEQVGARSGGWPHNSGGLFPPGGGYNLADLYDHQSKHQHQAIPPISMMEEINRKSNSGLNSPLISDSGEK